MSVIAYGLAGWLGIGVIVVCLELIADPRGDHVETILMGILWPVLAALLVIKPVTDGMRRAYFKMKSRQQK
jgi:hypothetical protein